MTALGLPMGFGAELVAWKRTPSSVAARWTLDVSQMDGAPVSHTEFEKVLDWSAPMTLAALVNSLRSAQWQIALSGATASCASDFPVAVQPSGDPNVFELAGCFRTASPPADRRIESVQTVVPLAGGRRILMDHTLIEPIAVTGGQTVDVKVIFRAALR
jgi:hypothetical protein